ncbi:hypothetical protein Tco_0512462 [Tanacetum coccineum]
MVTWWGGRGDVGGEPRRLHGGGLDMAAVVRMRMVVLAVGGDGGDDGEVVVMVIAVVAAMVRRWSFVICVLWPNILILCLILNALNKDLAEVNLESFNDSLSCRMSMNMWYGTTLLIGLPSPPF